MQRKEKKRGLALRSRELRSTIVWTKTPRSRRIVWFFAPMLLLTIVSMTYAEKMPDWMKGVPQAVGSTAHRAGYVWLVLGGKGNDVFEAMTIESFPVFVNVDRRRVMLDDLQLTVKHDGQRFQFTREDLAYILYYTHLAYALDGPPLVVSYEPRVYSKTGDWIREKYSTNVGSQLRPDILRYETRQVAELYGKKKEKVVEERLKGPVLALAWSRANAEKAREKIQTQYAGERTARVLVKWDEEVFLETSKGRLAVAAFADYETEARFNSTSKTEMTTGEVGISVNGRVQKVSFKNRCEDPIAARYYPSHRCEHYPHVRVNQWKNDSIGIFDKLHFGSQGVHVFLNTSERQNDSQRDVGFAKGVRFDSEI